MRQNMGQHRLNDVMLRHMIHKQRTDVIDLKTVARAFICANDERIRYLLCKPVVSRYNIDPHCDEVIIGRLLTLDCSNF